MKKILLLLSLMAMAVVAHAQRIQVVDADGLPIAAVDQLFKIEQKD